MVLQASVEGFLEELVVRRELSGAPPKMSEARHGLPG